MPRLEEEKFSLLVIDPPWPKKKGGKRNVRKNQGRELDYQTMTVEEIFQLLDDAIFPLAAKKYNVFLWSIDSFLFLGESEMLARGYHLHARIVWDKMNGVAPAFTVRYSHEYLSWFYKTPMLPVASEARGKFMTVIREKSREHSRKPDLAYEMLSTLYPESRKLDVFSREKREGWEQYGNQIDKFTQERIDDA